MKASNNQIGGNHYSKLAIQPMEYALKNGLNYAQANVVKYVTRYKDKGGIEDLRKAIHCIELLIQHETEQVAQEWPPEERIDIISQNGNDGLHYKAELLAIPDDVVIPDWCGWIGVDANGGAFGYCSKPDKHVWRYYMANGSQLKHLWRGSENTELRLYRRANEGFERVE